MLFADGAVHVRLRVAGQPSYRLRSFLRQLRCGLRSGGAGPSRKWRWAASRALCTVHLNRIGLPAMLRRGAVAHVLAVQALMLALVLGVTALWLNFSTSAIVLAPREGTNPAAQLAGMMAQLSVFASAVLTTLRLEFGFWTAEMIGVLGWLTLPLPVIKYVTPVLAVIAAAMTERRVEPRISSLEVGWPQLRNRYNRKIRWFNNLDANLSYWPTFLPNRGFPQMWAKSKKVTPLYCYKRRR